MAHDLAVARTTEEGQVNLDKCGYTVHEDFLRAPELAALRERLEEQAELERAAGVATLSGSGHAAKDKYIGAPKPDERVGYQMVSFLVNKGRVFLDLLHNPVIHDYAAHLFRGEPYNLATHNGVILHKGSSSQVLHADQQAIPLVLDRPVMFAMMICLSDFEADMGATLVAPGSHRFPLPQLDGEPAEQVKEIGSELVPLTAPAGSALFWESRTWHGQGGSTSDKARVSIGSIWAQHFVKPQDFFPAIVHDDVYETLTDADKEVLGFRVVREFGGAIGPRSPGDRRSNLNVRYPYIPELGKGGSKRAVPLDLTGAPGKSPQPGR
jgi:ectoine hydroxylase-related dioxygenase (phytanoyl-CoA dioxygenase family)